MFSDADFRNRSGRLFHRSGPTNPKAAVPIAFFGTGRCNSRSLGWRKRLSRQIEAPWTFHMVFAYFCDISSLLCNKVCVQVNLRIAYFHQWHLTPQ